MAVNPSPPSAAFPASSPFSASAPFSSANPPIFSASAPADPAAPSPVRPHKPTGRHGATDQQRRRELALERQRAARRDLQLHARHVALAATGAVTLADEVEARESAAAAPESREVSPLLPEICEFDEASGQWTRIDQEGFRIDGSGRRIEPVDLGSDASGSTREPFATGARIDAAEGEGTEEGGVLGGVGNGEGVFGMVREAGGEGMEMDGDGDGDGEGEGEEDGGGVVGIEQEMRGLFVPRGEARGRRGKGGAGGRGGGRGGRGGRGGVDDNVDGADKGVTDGAREWYAQQLMLPEWMVDVPPRLASDWFVMPRPDGRRCLVVSANGTTVSRLRNDRILHRFPSHLPNGARAPGIAAGAHVYCILDCIFHEPNNTYYVLDVMAWRGYSLYDCTAEFRLFWLQTHLPQCGACDPPSHFHRFRFAPVPFFECHCQGLEAAYCGWREVGGGAVGAGGTAGAGEAGEAGGAGGARGEMGGVEGAGVGGAAAGGGLAATVAGGSANGGASVPTTALVEFTRDGLLFYNRHSHYTLGLSPLVLQWKDAACSRFVIDTDGAGKIPEQQQVVLLLAADGSLVTSDDPPVVFGSLPPHTLNDPSLHLRPNKLLRFAIDPGGLYLGQGRVVGADLLFAYPPCSSLFLSFPIPALPAPASQQASAICRRWWVVGADLLFQGAANQRRGGADSCSKDHKMWDACLVRVVGADGLWDMGGGLGSQDVGCVLDVLLQGAANQRRGGADSCSKVGMRVLAVPCVMGFLFLFLHISIPPPVIADPVSEHCAALIQLRHACAPPLLLRPKRACASDFRRCAQSVRRFGSHLALGFPSSQCAKCAPVRQVQVRRPTTPLRASAFLRTHHHALVQPAPPLLPLMLPRPHHLGRSPDDHSSPFFRARPSDSGQTCCAAHPNRRRILRSSDLLPHILPYMLPRPSLSASCALPATAPLARLYPTQRVRSKGMDAMAPSEERQESCGTMLDGSRVTVGVLSKWVHIGRGWAPRLFLLRQHHLLYFKLRGSSTAAMIRKLQQRYNCVALIGRAVSDLIGDYNEGMLRQGDEEEGKGVGEGGDEEEGGGEGGDEEEDEEDADEGEGGDKLLAASPRRSPLESCGYGGGRMEGEEGEVGEEGGEGEEGAVGDSKLDSFPSHFLLPHISSSLTFPPPSHFLPHISSSLTFPPSHFLPHISSLTFPPPSRTSSTQSHSKLRTLPSSPQTLLQISSLRPSRSDPTKFYLATSARTLILCAESAEDRSLWLQAIEV
ncbi:unnamed protein product [Closterium sp. Naga37s-1]|nr:unnamed protein product [Closterium sp. Naga37s-1]